MKELTQTPAAWLVYWGILEMRPAHPAHATKELAEVHAKQIKSNTEIRPLFLAAPNSTAKDSTHQATVDSHYHWHPIDASTPRGTKMQLINRSAGVAVFGTLSTNPEHWTHWAPIPTFGDGS